MTNKNVIFGGVDPNDDQPLFWNNDFGWVDLSNATLFKDEERATYKDLPQYHTGVFSFMPSVSVWVTLPK
jgi:hypothetical protein